jgi:serine/threonine-protein kinase
MPKGGDVVAGKYRVEQLIGVGGMGAVFSAVHQYTGKRVALKWMLPELAQDADAVQRFMREAHAAGRINHPNVVDVYDVGEHDESYFLVMEYLQGEPLTSALARRDLTATEVLTLLLPAMRGVAAAHRQSVVHRDLKPDNIFLAYEEDGVRREAKVLDFGISKVATEGQVDLRLTRTGAVVGTPYYMSPEQIRGSAGLDRRADVYAFGVILYEALTGRVPFQADTYGALVLEIATGTATPLDEIVPSLPAELSRIVLRAMARDMNQRYPTMESLIAALEPFASSSGAGRVDLRSRRSLPGPAFEATHVSSSPSLPPQPFVSAPHVPTKPQLASTPFVSEMHEGQRRPNTILGAAAFLGAAAALVAGIWYFTREPEVSAAEHALITSPSAATQAPASTPLPEAPSITMPAASTAPVTPAPSAARVPAMVLAQPASQARIAQSQGHAAPPPTAAAPAAAEPSHVVRISRKHTPARSAPAPAAPEVDDNLNLPLPEAPPSPPPVHRARSGSLNVNEF